jgi:uncharacterized OB-fold protein
MSEPTRPLPVIDAMMAPYWAATRRHELLVPECDDCGGKHFPPEAVCPACLSDWHWATSPGVGTVYSYSVVRRPAAPGFPDIYVLALVELDDGGWLMTTNLIDIEPDAVTVAMPVRVKFVVESDDITLPYFAPAS